jgi:hypothetical protein
VLDHFEGPGDELPELLGGQAKGPLAGDGQRAAEVR